MDYCLFASDEGVLYPEALWTQWRIPLARLVLVKLEAPEEVWRVALEAVQVGLFRWVVIRPSRACPTGQLRKLQLSAEHAGVRVLLLAKHKLPHWVCQSTVEVGVAATPENPFVARQRDFGPHRAHPFSRSEKGTPKHFQGPPIGVADWGGGQEIAEPYPKYGGAISWPEDEEAGQKRAPK